MTTRTNVASAGGGLAAGIAGALALLGSSEGYVSKGYLDPVGIPTACWGHTGPDVVVGKSYGKAQCEAWKKADVERLTFTADKCLTRPIPAVMASAYVDFVYNLGSGPFCRSFAPLINRGDLAGACARLSLYHYAGGQSWPGLVKRRARERALCEAGLT